MEYPGFRVSISTSFGKMKDKIQIDIGVGDSVEPIEADFHPFEYKGKPIFEGEITLLTYPVESIFAEKLETLIFKGASNSRMKDYHDLTLMIRESGLLTAHEVAFAIAATFKNRGTEFKVPIAFNDDEMPSLQRLWNDHLRSLGEFRAKLALPEKIEDVIAEINAWLGANGVEDVKS